MLKLVPVSFLTENAKNIKPKALTDKMVISNIITYLIFFIGMALALAYAILV